MAKMGRPSDNPRTDDIHVRVSPSEKKQISECTKKHGIKIVDLIMLGIKTIEKK